MAFQGRILTPKNEKQREIPQRYMVSLPWHLPYIITMVIWYHMVSYGITWYHMVSHGITWYHMVSHGIIVSKACGHIDVHRFSNG